MSTSTNLGVNGTRRDHTALHDTTGGGDVHANAADRTGRVMSTTDSRFAFDVVRQPGPVLVEFHAPWCRTCQLLEPVLDELASTWADRLRIVSVDLERHPGAAHRHHVRSIPTLVLLDHGTELGRLVDVIRRERIDDWLHGHLDPDIDGPVHGQHQQGTS